MTILKPSMQLSFEEELTCSPQEHPVSLQASQGSEKARKMTVGSGTKCLELYAIANPHGSSLRTFLDCLVLKGEWYSRICFLKWKLLATKHKRYVFQLAVSTPRTDENEFGLLPTPRAAEADGGTCEAMNDGSGFYRTNAAGVRWGVKLKDAIAMLPTPRVSMANGASQKEIEAGNPKGRFLTALALIPTPTTRDYKDVGNMENVPSNPLLGRTIGKGTGLKLHPRFAEWMMGYPDKWTELND